MHALVFHHRGAGNCSPALQFQTNALNHSPGIWGVTQARGIYVTADMTKSACTPVKALAIRSCILSIWPEHQWRTSTMQFDLRQSLRMAIATVLVALFIVPT